MPVTETDLPGVGKKHEIGLGNGESLIVLTHNSGRRDVYKRPQEDADSELIFTLSDQLARTVGTILEGAHFQPIGHDTRETMLPGGAMIEWFTVEDDGQIVGQSLEEADIHSRTGASIITIERDDGVIVSPGPGIIIQTGDTLIAVGDRDAVEALEQLLDGAGSE